jgi:hypothetical protein
MDNIPAQLMAKVSDHYWWVEDLSTFTSGAVIRWIEYVGPTTTDVNATTGQEPNQDQNQDRWTISRAKIAVGSVITEQGVAITYKHIGPSMSAFTYTKQWDANTMFLFCKYTAQEEIVRAAIIASNGSLEPNQTEMDQKDT